MIRNASAEINKIISEGVSLLPANEFDKSVRIKWGGKDPLNPIQLFDAMDAIGTSAIAAVLGTASRRLCCIDVDSKHKAGFDAIFLSDLKSFFPDFYDKFRIERTPSGGLHLFYRIAGDQELPGCPKLANRWSTEEELIHNPKEKTKCFLELKCEGGLTQVYPSPNYSRVQDNGLHILTWEQHSSIFNLCLTYNETFQVEKTRAPKTDIDFYDENPFEHFDRSEEARNLLKEDGWVELKSRGAYDYYGKPGSKSKEVHASYNVEKNLYKIFTTQTVLDTKAYSPSNLIAALKFNGDKKTLRAYLIAKGFGIIKKHHEQRIIKQRAQFGGELPSNISAEAKEEFEKQKEVFQERYPFGVFWVEDEKGFSINRKNLYDVLRNLGFRLHGSSLCRIKGYYVEKIEKKDLFDEARDYILKDEDKYDEIFNCYETFLQKSGTFTLERLDLLGYSEVLRTKKEVSYKCYQNGYVEVTRDSIELKEYITMDKLVWKHQVQDREFKFGDHTKGLYYDFLSKAVGFTDHTLQCIGYYAHEYKSTMTPYIVVLCEECEDYNKGGGTGKNVFTNLLRFVTSLLNKPGKNVKFDDTLLRTWKGEKVFSLNDLPKKFDFVSLRENSSGEGEVGKKFMQEAVIRNEDMPKTICNTNYSFDPHGPGLKRRMIGKEFTGFFSEYGGVDVYYGKAFPNDDRELGDWVEEDWIGFDNCMMLAIQKFIQNNCKLNISELTDTGWKKQFEGKYSSHTYQFITENIDDWCIMGEVKINEVFNKRYDEFITENKIDRKYILSSIRMNEALENYCAHFFIHFIKYKNVGKINGVQTNIKVFQRMSKDVVFSETADEEDEFNLDAQEEEKVMYSNQQESPF